jgi:hypothetical protein
LLCVEGHRPDVDEADTGNHGGGNANDDDDDDDEYDTDDYEESLTNSNAGPENGGKKPRLKLGVASFYKDEEGIRRMKLVIDVGKAFQATDFVVQFVKDDKVQVRNSFAFLMRNLTCCVFNCRDAFTRKA